MSRILDYVLEPSVVYTNGSFLVKVKVQDDYKYKKLLVSENMKYTTATGTTYTLTNAVSTNNASILELEGNTTQSGTPTPTNPVDIDTVSGDNEVLVRGKNIFETKAQGNFSYGTTSTWNIDNDIITMSVNDSTFQGGAINLTTGATGRWASSWISDKKLTDNGGTYTFTLVKNGTITQATGGNVYLYYFYYNDTGTTGNGYLLVNNSLETVTKTITLASDQHIGAVCIYSQYVTCDNLKLKVMLEKGSTATTYEPYIGNSYRVDLGGKNLFDKDNTTIGRLDTVGNIYYDTSYYTSSFIKVNPNTTYTKNSPTANAYHRVCFYTTNNANGFISASNNNTNTTPSNCQYLRYCGLVTEKDTSQIEERKCSNTIQSLCI